MLSIKLTAPFDLFRLKRANIPRDAEVKEDAAKRET
jgi:hypothetical protein